MLYKQEASFLNYKDYTFSSFCYSYNPENPKHRQNFKINGSHKFCIPHNHIAIEIIRVLQGEMIVTIDREKIPIYPGDIVFINPLEIHIVSTERGDTYCEFQVINFDLSMLKTTENTEFNVFIDDIERENLKFRSCILTDSPISPVLTDAMINLHTAYKKEKNLANFMNIISYLLCFMATLTENGFTYKPKKEKVSSQIPFSKTVVQYIRNNYNQQLTTQKIATDLNFNKSYFCRNFKAVFNQTFVDYLNQYRISIAKNLSLDDYKTLNSIAQAVGYKNYDNFANCFKKITGYTPKEFYNVKRNSL